MLVDIRNRQTVLTASPDRPFALISITDPKSSFASVKLGAHGEDLKSAIFLRFADTSNDSLPYPGMTREQASLLASFIEVAAQEVELFVVNCDAGVSRSAGVAAAILAYKTGDDTFVFENPRYRPNMYVYRLLVNELVGPMMFDENSFGEVHVS